MVSDPILAILAPILPHEHPISSVKFVADASRRTPLRLCCKSPPAIPTHYAQGAVVIFIEGLRIICPRIFCVDILP